MKLTLSSLGTALWLATAGLIGVGCAGDSNHRSTGEQIDDRSTSSRVKDALGNDTQYKYSMVDVHTFKGTVQLSGFVNTRDQKSHAGDIAKRVEGVHDVVNNITIKESAN